MSSTSQTRRRLIPFALHMERRLETPRGMGALTTIGAVVVALLISAVIIWSQGGNPIDAYAHIARSSLGSIGVLSDTLVKATPLIFTGLACSVAFRMRLWNIGAEGQLMMGAWGASAVVLVGWLPEHYVPRYSTGLFERFAGVPRGGRLFPGLVLVAGAVALVFLLSIGTPPWEDDIATLSPIPESVMARDRHLHA